MTKKMSEAQRRYVWAAHATRTGLGTRMGMCMASGRTLRVLQRNGWVTGPFDLVTRAGLIAAGVDMDAIHADALNRAHQA